MGRICPECKTHQAFVKTLTADQEPARKAEQVIARKLACGHTVGGKMFNKFQKALAELQHQTAERIAEIKDHEQQEIGAMWAAISASTKDGGKP